jgi:3-phosphoshikimate 1-carboxyvinyltransferase
VLAVHPLAASPDLAIRVPGSKSLTNRALLCAALAPGRSTLIGVLFADDIRAMLAAVAALGAQVQAEEATGTVVITGTDPRIAPLDGTAGEAGGAAGDAAGEIRIDARQSGTTSRFILPTVALGPGRCGRGRRGGARGPVPVRSSIVHPLPAPVQASDASIICSRISA